MAKIPTYPQGQVPRQQLQGAKFSPSATPESFGAGNARALSRIGGGLADLGGEIARQNEIETLKLDKTHARNALNSAKEAMRRSMSVIYSKKSSEAEYAHEQAIATLESIKNDHLKQLKSRQAQEFFTASIDPLINNNLDGAISHQTKEREVARINSIMAENLEADQQAIANRFNDKMIAELIVDKELNTLEINRGVVGQEMITKQREQVNAMLAGVAKAIANDPATTGGEDKALLFLEKYKDKMFAQTYEMLKSQYTKEVEEKDKEAIAQNYASELYYSGESKENQFEKIRKDIPPEYRTRVRNILATYHNDDASFKEENTKAVFNKIQEKFLQSDDTITEKEAHDLVDKELDSEGNKIDLLTRSLWKKQLTQVILARDEPELKAKLEQERAREYGRLMYLKAIDINAFMKEPIWAQAVFLGKDLTHELQGYQSSAFEKMVEGPEKEKLKYKSDAASRFQRFHPVGQYFKKITEGEIDSVISNDEMMQLQQEYNQELGDYLGFLETHLAAIPPDEITPDKLRQIDLLAMQEWEIDREKSWGSILVTGTLLGAPLQAIFGEGDVLTNNITVRGYKLPSEIQKINAAWRSKHANIVQPSSQLRNMLYLRNNIPTESTFNHRRMVFSTFDPEDIKATLDRIEPGLGEGRGANVARIEQNIFGTIVEATDSSSRPVDLFPRKKKPEENAEGEINPNFSLSVEKDLK